MDNFVKIKMLKLMSAGVNRVMLVAGHRLLIFPDKQMVSKQLRTWAKGTNSRDLQLDQVLYGFGI